MEHIIKDNAPMAESAISAGLTQIKTYLEQTIVELKKELDKKDNEINKYRQQAEKAKNTIEGNTQLINKLLGDLSKLQNDIDWYKRTYERRSFLGTIRQKLFNKDEI